MLGSTEHQQNNSIRMLHDICLESNQFHCKIIVSLLKALFLAAADRMVCLTHADSTPTML